MTSTRAAMSYHNSRSTTGQIAKYLVVGRAEEVMSQLPGSLGREPCLPLSEPVEPWLELVKSMKSIDMMLILWVRYVQHWVKYYSGPGRWCQDAGARPGSLDVGARLLGIAHDLSGGVSNLRHLGNGRSSK